MKDNSELVIELHNIARQVEATVGKGQLSEDIRNCADRLHTLTKQQRQNNERTMG
jgi:hypothetical protein